MIKLTCLQADITTLSTDVIVNAANSSLLGGGGVDGAIHRRAGTDLLKECRMIGGCPTGEARLTAGYQLKAKFIIHAVGPIWQGGKAGEADLLANCYRSSLILAEQNQCRQIAFPAISTGIYGYPKQLAAAIAVSAAQDFMPAQYLKEVIFCLFDSENYQLYQKLLHNLSGK